MSTTLFWLVLIALLFAQMAAADPFSPFTFVESVSLSFCLSTARAIFRQVPDECERLVTMSIRQLTAR